MTNATLELRPWPTDPRYRVSEDGTIYGTYGRPVRGRSNGKGYLQITVWLDGRRRNVRVHKIVCETWHGPAPTPEHEVAHGDGDKGNNHPDNLSWKTPEENRDDMRRHHREGLYADRGPSITVSCKLTPDNVRAIRWQRAQGAGIPAMAVEFGVSVSSIRHVLRGDNYTWVN